MSISTDRDHFFQTTSSLELDARRSNKSKNKNGNPITCSTKILAVAQDPNTSNVVYIAESAGVVKRVDLTTHEVTKIYRGPNTPLTSICFSSNGQALFAGCWDKVVWSWDVSLASVGKLFRGHNDFVKAIVMIPAVFSPTKSELLVSGGADSEIIFWNIESGERLYVLKGHTRGIQDLVLDPDVDPLPTEGATKLALWSASSSREIRPCIVEANPSSSEDPAQLKNLLLGHPILPHDTSVYRLRFDEDGDMWTASADKTVLHLLRSQNWKSDTTLAHPDFVNDLVIHETGGWVITACRDEEVRVWNRASGVLHHTFSGHFDSVTGLCLLEDTNTLISVSIDATIRIWSMKAADLEQARKDAQNPKTDIDDAEEHRVNVELTEEEERELAELMAENE